MTYQVGILRHVLESFGKVRSDTIIVASESNAKSTYQYLLVCLTL
jgi:hypothetical protein